MVRKWTCEANDILTLAVTADLSLTLPTRLKYFRVSESRKLASSSYSALTNLLFPLAVLPALVVQVVELLPASF